MADKDSGIGSRREPLIKPAVKRPKPPKPELTPKERARKKTIELQKRSEEQKEPEPNWPESFESNGGCLRDRRNDACSGTPIRVGRWKGRPNFICVCGFPTISVSAEVMAAARKAGVK